MRYTPDIDQRQGDRLPIAPSRWGPTMWDTLHYVSLGYPAQNPTPEMRQAALEFMRALPFLLPCRICREHLAETYMMDMPLDTAVFASRQAFGEYIVQLRDLVRQRHVCPGCASKTHSFPEDVAERLLRKPMHAFPRWILLIPIPLLLWTLYRCLRRQNGKPAVSTRLSTSSSYLPVAKRV